MNIDVTEDGTIRLKNVFDSVIFETDEGEKLIVCMRDGAFEIALKNTSVTSKEDESEYFRWYSANSEGVTDLCLSGDDRNDNKNNNKI